MISIIIATKNRKSDLVKLLSSIYKSKSQYEIIIVDDSNNDDIRRLVESSYSETSMRIHLEYIRGNGEGLAAARNLGIAYAKGDLISLLDDDVILPCDFFEKISSLFDTTPIAIGISPAIIDSFLNKSYSVLYNTINRVLGLDYRENNKMIVRRSATSVFPSNVTSIINAQRLFGCCCIYRRHIFNKLQFDAALKRYSYMEDLDFSYRVYRLYPNSLFIINSTHAYHTHSEIARLPQHDELTMKLTYWAYVFFKNRYDHSLFNFFAFCWGILGNFVISLTEALFKHDARHTVSIFRSHFILIQNMRSLYHNDLSYVNDALKKSLINER